MIGSPLARAYEAPGPGLPLGHGHVPPLAAARRAREDHPERLARADPARPRPRERRHLQPHGQPAHLDGHLRLRGHPPFHRAEVMVAPSLQTEGKQLQRDQAIGMGATSAAKAAGAGGRRHQQRRSAQSRGATALVDVAMTRATRPRVPSRPRPRGTPPAARGTAPRRGPGPRLRRAVLAADRAAGARVRRVRRAAAARLPARGDPRARAARPDPLRRARLGLRGRRARAAPGAARARGPGAGHLLRDAGDGARARRARRGRRGGRVRPLAR